MNKKNIYTSEAEIEDITKYESDISTRSEYSSETDIEKEIQEDKYATAKPKRIIIIARLIND